MRALAVFSASLFLAACLSSDPISGNGGAGGESSDGGAPSTYVGGQEPIAGGDVGDPCGDGVCSIDETCTTCPEDCPCSGPVCGDGSCDEATEDCETCEEDCGACAMCGDGTCDEPAEDCDTCFEDCGICLCEPDDFEPNQGSPTATPISAGVDYCDLSICTADVDWFEFQVTNGATVELAFTHAEGDLELEIYSEATGAYVTGSYSGDDDELVNLNGEPNGTYWARVYGDAASPVNPDYCIRVD